MNTIVVGFGFQARHGKDTAVKAIVDAREKSMDVRRYAFADALKREVNDAASANGGMQGIINRMRNVMPDWVVYDPNPDMTDPLCPLGKQRTLLQWWGTEYRRRTDPYYWVKQLYKTLQKEDPQVALISDMRFPNEFQWVKSLDGRTVKVVRCDFYDAALNTGHESECALKDAVFDYTILAGDGQVDHLKQCAVECFDMICKEFETPVEVAEGFDVASLTA
jgi:hypothetical protein